MPITLTPTLTSEGACVYNYPNGSAAYKIADCLEVYDETEDKCRDSRYSETVITEGASKLSSSVVTRSCEPSRFPSIELTVTITDGTFTDNRDGKPYRTVKINVSNWLNNVYNKTWMAENVNYSGIGTSKCYNNDPDNCTKYGRLYNWEAVRYGYPCPSGWHVPSDDEWQKLLSVVGNYSGTKLKATSGWNYNGNGTDEFGFSALPGGFGYSDGGFYDVGSYGSWWSATEYDASIAYSRNMSYSDASVGMSRYSKTHLHSVRCVQN
jgi:uncharacterized protein (TIGR02145 family)